MCKFRPCIDLHQGKVKQIVGASLDDSRESVSENFVAQQSAGWYAAKYANDQLTGGHVIKLGPGNDLSARDALASFPGGLQIGGGINLENAEQWLDAGASKVIVTSWLFDQSGRFQDSRLDDLVASIGKEKIVLDLSCKQREPGKWTVAMNRWQTLTDLDVSIETLEMLSGRCGEFLIHAADVEGLCQGIDEALVRLMGRWGKVPMTYAGGIASMDDVKLIASAAEGKVDFTVGSALDLFGGTGVRYEEMVAWNRTHPATS